MKFSGLVITFFVLLASNCIGQSITWQRIINNNYSNYKKVIQTHDNYYVAVGFDKISTIDFLVISKFDNYGNEIWHKIIGNGNSEGEWIEETNDNSYIVCGSTHFDNIRRIYLVKTDTSGAIIWEKNYFYSDLNNAYCVKETNDNGFVVAGMTFPNNAGIFLLKTDSLGNVINQKIFINNFQQQVYEIIEVNDYYWAIGYSTINNIDLLVLKLDLNLDTVITKRFGGSNVDGGYSINKIENEGIILGGISKSFNASDLYETYIIRIDTNFNLIWQKTFTTNYNEICKSIIYKPGIGILAAGSLDSIGNISSAKLRLLDLNGNILKEKTYLPGTLGAGFESAELTNDNGVIAAGYVTYAGAFEKMYIVKTDSLLFAEPIGLVSISAEIPKSFVLYQNYPNPFNPETQIKFDVPKSSNIKIAVYDMLGREVAILVNGKMEPGVYNASWYATPYASGVYFYRLEADGYIDTKKMVLLK